MKNAQLLSSFSIHQIIRDSYSLLVGGLSFEGTAHDSKQDER